MKNNLKKILLSIALIISIASNGLINPALAASEDSTQNTSMFVSPMIQEILLVPGETYEGYIKVANSATAKHDLNYRVEVGPYLRKRSETSNDDYGVVDTTERTEQNLMMDWITIENESGIVSPNTNDVINFSIKVPNTAPAGAQYASIIVMNDTDNSSSDAEGIAIKNKMQIVSAIIANIAGETIEKGQILENSIPSFLASGALESSSMVRNEGNIYTNAEYTLQVWPLFSNEELCTNEEKPDSSLILPDTERYHSQTCDLPTIGIFKAKQVVKIFGETSITEKMVIKCPIWLLFIIIFAITAIIIYFIAKARKRNIKKETA